MQSTIFRRHLLVLLLYGVAALVLTWPLARHFTTHMPGNGIDDPALGWNLWWVKHQLIDLTNLDIFHVGWMFHPIGVNLAFYTLTPLNGLISIPLQTLFGLIVANNLLVWSSFVLSGYGTFLLALDQLLGSEVRVSSKDLVDDNDRIVQSSFLTKAILEPRTSIPAFHPNALILSATAAGFVYAFASAKLFYVALGQYNIASSQWIPFCVLYVLRIGRSASLRQAVRNGTLAAIFLVFQAWAELTYASFLLIFIGIYFVWLIGSRVYRQRHIHRPSQMPSGSTHRLWSSVGALWARPSSIIIAPFLVMAALFLVGLAPLLWAMLPDLRAEGDFFTSGGGFSEVFSADLAGYLVPTRLHPLFGNWVAGLPFPNDVGQQIFLGYSLLVLAAIGAWVTIQNPKPKIKNQGTFWLFTTLFFWWMTLGPHIRWMGKETPIPGPFALISLLPFFNGNRYPSRYSVMVLLGAAVLVGFGLCWLLQHIEVRSSNRDAVVNDAQLKPPTHFTTSLITHHSSLLLLLLAIIFLFEHLSLPLPLVDFRVPEIYQTLAKEPGDFAVLELPTGWRNGARVLGRSDKLIMMQEWYQTEHGKRRLGGNTSRNPPYKFDYFTNAPLLGDLIALMNADRDYLAPVIADEYPALVKRNRPIAAQVLRDLGIRFVTVQVERSPAALLRFVDEALPLTLVKEWHGADWEEKPSTIRLYQVDAPAQPPSWEKNLAAPDGRLYLGEGWSSLASPDKRFRWATRADPLLLLDLPEGGGGLELQLFGPATAVEVWLNGRRLASSSLSGGADEHWLSLEVPAGVADQFIDRLELRFAGGLTPVSALAGSPFVSADPQDWMIGKTGVGLANVASLVVQSAGNDVGDYAHIWVNGRQVAKGEIGYNLVALDPLGAVLDSATFNTFAAPEQSAALAAWLAQWPAGTVIAGAVRDEASHSLQAEAVDALQKIGVAGDLRGKFRWSHAFIGAVGAPPGSALENVGLLQPATVSIGAPVDGEAVSGGAGLVRFKQAHN